MKLAIATALVAACVSADKGERKLRRHSRKPKYDICGKKNYKKDVPKMSGPQTSLQLLLDNKIITKMPSSLCTAGTGKRVILVIGDGMGWEMARAGAIAKRVLDELKTMGVDTVNGSTGTVADAAKAAFSGRQLKDYYLEGVCVCVCVCVLVDLLSFVVDTSSAHPFSFHPCLFQARDPDYHFRLFLGLGWLRLPLP